MQPWVGFKLGVMSKVGRRAANSRISSVISSTEAEVPMASGTSRWRPPLVERSVTVTPPHWVTQLIACATSASTAAWPPRLVSKSIGSSCVRPLVYKCTAAGRVGRLARSGAVWLNLSVSGDHTRMRVRPGAATSRAKAFQTAAGCVEAGLVTG